LFIENNQYKFVYFYILDECGWEDISWSGYSWSRAKGSEAVLTSPKAPPYDHTLNNGNGW
jgi:hypothetical protein